VAECFCFLFLGGGKGMDHISCDMQVVWCANLSDTKETKAPHPPPPPGGEKAALMLGNPGGGFNFFFFVRGWVEGGLRRQAGMYCAIHTYSSAGCVFFVLLWGGGG